MKDEAMFLSVMKVWAATAWADGVLAPSERRLLEGMIDGAKVSDAARATAHGFLTQQVLLSDTNVDTLGDRERHGVYRSACRLTTIDRHLDDTERAFLRQLAERLELAPDDAAEIERTYLRETPEKA